MVTRCCRCPRTGSCVQATRMRRMKTKRVSMLPTGVAVSRKRAGCTTVQGGRAYGRPATWKPSACGTARSVAHVASSWSLACNPLTEAFHEQLDPVQGVDIRQPSVHRQDLTWVTDYLIGCHATANPPAEADSDLCIFVGSNEYVTNAVSIPAAGR